MKPVFNSNAPRGHYSPGIISNGLLFISGQTSADPATQQPVPGGFAAEMQTALDKLASVLKAAGCDKNRVVSCHVYISDMNYWPQANELYAKFFGEHKPARIILPVGKLHNNCLVEIEAVAEI